MYLELCVCIRSIRSILKMLSAHFHTLIPSYTLQLECSDATSYEGQFACMCVYCVCVLIVFVCLFISSTFVNLAFR
jgi:hypothetical protein